MIEKITKRNSFTDLLLVTIGFFVSFGDSIPFCQGYKNLSFDNQAFLFWDFASSLNLTIYKDFFYPYGLMFYLQNNNLVWHYIALGISFILLFSIFLLLKTVLKERALVYVSFISTVIFLNLFLDHLSYLRYCPLVLFGFLIAYFANKDYLLRVKQNFLIGFIIGLLFSFINDLFFYASITYISFLFVYLFLNKSKNRVSLKKVFQPALALVIGFFLGSLPIIFYLIKRSIFNDFWFFYSSLGDISLFAKIPFPPALRSFENLFILFILSATLLSLLSSYVKRERIDFSFYLKLSLFLALIALEQKNIIRSIYTQISFIGYLLFIILLYDLNKSLRAQKIGGNKILLLSMSALFLVIAFFIYDRKLVVGANVPVFNSNNSSLCLEQKVSYLNPTKLKSHLKVKHYIESANGKEKKIFSFPGDPVFYLLFNQKPPYYPSIYEATPAYAQKKLIEYIKQRNVKYVIYNTKSDSIQDGVPDKIRAAFLYSYIATNFRHIEKIDDFLILEKLENESSTFYGR